LAYALDVVFSQARASLALGSGMQQTYQQDDWADVLFTDTGVRDPK